MSGSPLKWVEPDWPAPSLVHALTTERGASQPDDPYDGFNFADYVADVPAKVEANRDTLVKALGLTCLPVWLDQQHGNPAAVFLAQRGGQPKKKPYPTAAEFEAIRAAAELPSCW